MALPLGVSLSTDGELSGTPEESGTFEFSVLATNRWGFDQTSVFTLVISDPTAAPVWVLDDPPDGHTGSSYAYQFVASGEPDPTYSVLSGSIPAGTTLDTTTGMLSGAPTTVATYTFVIRATNTAGHADTPSISVDIASGSGGTPPAFVNDEPPNATDGTVYSYTFTATGTGPITFSKSTGSLPTGLSLSSGGVLSGTSTAPGRYKFRVTAANAAGSVTTPTITMLVVQAPAFTDADPDDTGTVDTPYFYEFSATGYPNPEFQVGSGTIPLGLSLTESGELSGTPTDVGEFTFTIQASNLGGMVETDELTITVNESGGGGGDDHENAVWVTGTLIEEGEPINGNRTPLWYFDGYTNRDCMWEVGGVPGKCRSYYYKNLAERVAAVRRILKANVPIGIGIDDPLFGVLPVEDDTVGMFEPYGSGFYGFGIYGG